MRALLSATLVVLGIGAPVASAPVLVNGGFENGFSGWTQVSNLGGTECDADWYVSATDTACNIVGFASDLGPANQGSAAAWNAFDAFNPNTNYVIEQDFVISAGVVSAATLSWDLTYGWDNAAASTTQPRTFSLSFFDSADALVDRPFLLEVFQPTPSVQVGWTNYSVDVTSALLGYEGQTLTLVADAFIPEGFVGPGSLGLDAVSLDIELSAVPIPVGLPLILSALGAVGVLSRFRRTA